jgi:hypothetical protein
MAKDESPLTAWVNGRSWLSRVGGNGSVCLVGGSDETLGALDGGVEAEVSMWFDVAGPSD